MVVKRPSSKTGVTSSDLAAAARVLKTVAKITGLAILVFSPLAPLPRPRPRLAGTSTAVVDVQRTDREEIRRDDPPW